MNALSLLNPKTYIDAVSETLELAREIKRLPRLIDSLAASAERMADAADMLVAVTEPLVAVQERIDLGAAADVVRRGTAAMTGLAAAAVQRKPSSPSRPATKPRPERPA
jgi:ABC-type transporter Mla subunit MlaD